MSSFYGGNNARMGFAWLAPVVQLVGGQLQSQPLDTRNPYAAMQQPSSPWPTVGLAVAGLVLLGGVYFYLVRR